jgi:hypothetical protein
VICQWPSGCGQGATPGDSLCYYHRKRIIKLIRPTEDELTRDLHRRDQLRKLLRRAIERAGDDCP